MPPPNTAALSNRLAAMLHELKRKAMQNPEDPEARYALAEALFSDKQFEAAIKQLEKAIELAPDHAPARLMLARTYRHEERLTLAERALEQLVQRHPKNTDARDDLADILAKAGRLDDAIVHLEEATRVDPDNINRRRFAAELSITRRLFPRARGHLEHALKLKPDDRDIEERLHFVLVNLGVSIKGSPPSASAAERLEERGLATLASEPLRRALPLGPLRTAAACLAQRDLAGAKRALVTAGEDDQKSPTFSYLRGEIWLLSGDRERAEAAFRSAAERPDGLPPALGRLGDLSAAAGDHAGTVRWYEAWAKVAPTDPDVLEALGDALAAAGRSKEARSRFERAVTIRPSPALTDKILALGEASPSSPGAASDTLVRIGALLWNPFGGGISLVEAMATPGKGNLLLTGSAGPAIHESAKVALSCLKARAETLGLGDAVERTDLHLNFVDMGQSKDGASAGIALALACYSALTGKPLRGHLAATGEITLQGAVRRIDGLHEKIMGAYLAGIHTVIVPRKNLFDTKRLPAEVVSRVEVIYVDSLTEAVETALDPREGE